MLYKYKRSEGPNLRCFEIVCDSNLQTIEDGAFSDSVIESLLIPSSVKEHKEELCHNTENLKNVDTSVVNDELNIVLCENEFIIGKKWKKSNEYDVFLMIVLFLWFHKSSQVNLSIPPFDGLEEFWIENSSMEEKILSKISKRSNGGILS